MKLLPFTVIALLALGAGALADPADNSLAAMRRCAQLGDAQTRLACYDRVAPDTRNLPPAASAAAPAPPPVPVASSPAPRQHQNFFQEVFGNAPRAPQTSVAQFGSESLETGGESASSARIKGDTVNAINAHMASYALSPTGVITVTLDNGQVWRQVSGGVYAHLVKRAPAYSVRIDRGSFAPYKMTITGISEVFDVRRIK